MESVKRLFTLELKGRVGCLLKNNRPYFAKHDSLNLNASMTTMVVLRHMEASS